MPAPVFGAIGAKSAGGTTALAVAYPASVAAGNALLLARVSWLSTATHTAISGWTARSSGTSGTGTAADSHTSRSSWDTREAVGGETGTVATAQAGTISGAMGVMLRYSKSAGSTWSFGGPTVSGDTSHGANRATSTGGAVDLQVDDIVVALVAVDTDTALASVSAPLFVATGITFSTPVRRTPATAGVLTGLQGNLEVFEARVTAGAATVGIAFSMTTATLQCGPVSWVRLREVPPPPSTGVLDAEGPTPTAQIVGETAITGTADVTGPAPTATLEGTAEATGVAGSVAAVGPVPQVAAAGTTRITGAALVVGPRPTVAASGTVRAAGVIAAAGPRPTVAAAGTPRIAGVLAAVGPRPTVAATGVEILPVTGIVAATGPRPTVTAAGALRVTGAVAAVGPSRTVAISGAVGSVSVGELVAVGPRPSTAIAGSLRVTGTAAATGPAHLVEAVGLLVVDAQVAAVGPIPVVEIVGLLIAAGDAVPVQNPGVTLELPSSSAAAIPPASSAASIPPTSEATLAIPTSRADLTMDGYTRNDTGPDLVVTLTSKPVVALTGATVIVRLRKPGSLAAVTLPGGQVTFNPDARTVTIRWEAGDLAVEGRYRLEVEATYSNNMVQTFPGAVFYVAAELV